MKHLLAIAVVLGACKGGGDKAADKPPSPPPAPLVEPSDAVLPLAKVPAPDRVVWLDRSGALSYARAASPWTGVLPAQRTPAANLEALSELFARETEEREAKLPADPLSGGFASLEVGAAVVEGRVPTTIGTRDSDTETLVVVAPPDASATAVIDVLAQLGGRPVVALPADRMGALRIVFAPREANVIYESTGISWVELHLGVSGIDVVRLMANEKRHVAWGTTTSKELEPFMVQGWDDPDRLDVLVAKDVPYQRLLDLLVILDDLGVVTVGVGPSPGPVDGRRAQVLELHNQGGTYRSATGILSLGVVNAQGDLDMQVIRDLVKAKGAEITACYDAALAKHAGLRGTIVARFFIGPKGAVASSEAGGTDAEAAACIAKLIKTLTFPAPKGGGGVQVSYPFTFRPVET